MEFTLIQQGTCFLWSIVCGVFIAVIYDLFRLSRLMFFKGKVAVFLCDFVFVFISGLVSVVFSMGFSKGNTRYFIIIGEFLGFLAYKYTLGRILNIFFDFVISKISKILIKSAEKIRKTGKKLLQVAGSVLYNICKKSMRFYNVTKHRKGKNVYETRTPKEKT